jgi:hypothetical protein
MANFAISTIGSRILLGLFANMNFQHSYWCNLMSLNMFFSIAPYVLAIAFGSQGFPSM